MTPSVDTREGTGQRYLEAFRGRLAGLIGWRRAAALGGLGGMAAMASRREFFFGSDFSFFGDMGGGGLSAQFGLWKRLPPITGPVV